jgi:hypothetical protein
MIGFKLQIVALISSFCYSTEEHLIHLILLKMIYIINIAVNVPKSIN